MKMLLHLSHFLMGVGGFSTLGLFLAQTPYLIRSMAYFVALAIVGYAYCWICDQPTADTLNLSIEEHYAALFFSKAVILLGAIVILGVIWR